MQAPATCLSATYCTSTAAPKDAQQLANGAKDCHILQEMQQHFEAERVHSNQCWEEKLQQQAEKAHAACLKQKSEVGMLHSLDGQRLLHMFNLYARTQPFFVIFGLHHADETCRAASTWLM